LSSAYTYIRGNQMQPLGPGETTEPAPTPPAPPPGYAPQTRMPGGPRRVPPQPYPPQAYPEPPQYPRQAPPGAPGEAASATLAIRVQPSGAEITIDGERWQGPEGDDRLLVQVAEGSHRVEIQKSGFRRFTTEIQARRGETV